jgi:hypothetical protein
MLTGRDHRRAFAYRCLPSRAIGSLGIAICRKNGRDFSSGMTLALLIPIVGVVVLFIYFAFEAGSIDPWGRRR